jgi:hypothetical protein
MVTTTIEGCGGGPAVPVADPGTPEEFFADRPAGMAVYSAVHELLSRLGPVEVRVSRSHVGFRHGRGFAYLWRPGRWLRRPAAEVVLSFVLDRPLAAARIKEVVNPSRAVWIHHVELHRAVDVDSEIAGWLTEAYWQAWPHRRRGRRTGRQVDTASQRGA